VSLIPAVLNPSCTARRHDDVHAVRFQVLEDVEAVGKVEPRGLVSADLDDGMGFRMTGTPKFRRVRTVR